MPFQYTSLAKLFDAVVAVKYATDQSIETILKLQGHSVVLYRQLLDAIFADNASRKAPKCPKPLPPKVEILTQNRFAPLATMKDRKK